MIIQQLHLFLVTKFFSLPVAPAMRQPNLNASATQKYAIQEMQAFDYEPIKRVIQEMQPLHYEPLKRIVSSYAIMQRTTSSTTKVSMPTTPKTNWLFSPSDVSYDDYETTADDIQEYSNEFNIYNSNEKKLANGNMKPIIIDVGSKIDNAPHSDEVLNVKRTHDVRLMPNEVMIDIGVQYNVTFGSPKEYRTIKSDNNKTILNQLPTQYYSYISHDKTPNNCSACTESKNSGVDAKSFNGKSNREGIQKNLIFRFSTSDNLKRYQNISNQNESLIRDSEYLKYVQELKKSYYNLVPQNLEHKNTSYLITRKRHSHPATEFSSVRNQSLQTSALPHKNTVAMTLLPTIGGINSSLSQYQIAEVTTGKSSQYSSLRKYKEPPTSSKRLPNLVPNKLPIPYVNNVDTVTTNLPTIPSSVKWKPTLELNDESDARPLSKFSQNLKLSSNSETNLTANYRKAAETDQRAQRYIVYQFVSSPRSTNEQVSEISFKKHNHYISEQDANDKYFSNLTKPTCVTPNLSNIHSKINTSNNFEDLNGIESLQMSALSNDNTGANTKKHITLGEDSVVKFETTTKENKIISVNSEKPTRFDVAYVASPTQSSTPFKGLANVNNSSLANPAINMTNEKDFKATTVSISHKSTPEHHRVMNRIRPEQPSIIRSTTEHTSYTDKYTTDGSRDANRSALKQPNIINRSTTEHFSSTNRSLTKYPSNINRFTTKNPTNANRSTTEHSNIINRSPTEDPTNTNTSATENSGNINSSTTKHLTAHYIEHGEVAAPIKLLTDLRYSDGSYNFQYHTHDGSQRQESGENSPLLGLRIKGLFQ